MNYKHFTEIELIILLNENILKKLNNINKPSKEKFSQKFKRKEVAEKLGVGRGHLSDVLNGKKGRQSIINMIHRVNQYLKPHLPQHCVGKTYYFYYKTRIGILQEGEFIFKDKVSINLSVDQPGKTKELNGHYQIIPELLLLQIYTTPDSNQDKNFDFLNGIIQFEQLEHPDLNFIGGIGLSKDYGNQGYSFPFLLSKRKLNKSNEEDGAKSIFEKYINMVFEQNEPKKNHLRLIIPPTYKMVELSYGID